MEGLTVHEVSVNIANWLNRYAKATGTELQKLILGTEILLINVTKLLIIGGISIMCGLWKQTFITVFAFSILRRTASGLHARKSIVCTVGSLCMFVAVPFLLKSVVIPQYVIILIFLCTCVLFYKYAPADTEARPIIGKENRTSLKIRAVMSAMILLGFVLAINNEEIKLLLTLGAVYEAISILPITYKLLKRGWNNYEQYE